MPYISTWAGGSEQHHSVDRLPICCPYCDCKIHSDFQFAVMTHYGDGHTEPYEKGLEAVFQCPSEKCQHIFIVVYDEIYNSPDDKFYFAKVIPNCQVNKSHDQYIESLSPSFCSIWNQSYQAEQSGLKDICGAGYRKALEFLIKDYLIYLNPDNQDNYRAKFLGKCIKEDIEDPRIKACAERAVWIGNDEVHYDKRWGDKDIKDLKTLIELSLHWIMMEHLTNNYETDMNL